MQYIVWGAGQRGKKALEILGKERIHCFVDKNTDLIGKELAGIKIKDLNYIESVSDKFIVLVTPADYENQIIEELNQKGIFACLPFSDHPLGVDLSEKSECFSYFLTEPNVQGKLSLYGINWFNLYLYDYYKKIGMDVSICRNENNSEKIFDVIKDEYDIFYVSEVADIVDYFLAPEGTTNIPKNKNIDIESYIESLYPIYNETLSQYKDKHNGETCCIVATGPSLTISDLNMLKENNIKCISMNRIYNLFDRTSWRPDYYVIEDEKMIEDLAEEIASLELKHKFVNGGVKKYWLSEDSGSSIACRIIMQDCLTDKVGFSKHPNRFMYNGYTVTYVCLQLALYMGFSNIYLLGVDFSYSSDVYSKLNHFEGYQKHYKDIRLNAIMPDRMLKAYHKAKKVAEYNGVRIYNATRGGKLEAFERKTLESIITEERT